jgi:hypothetical protein
VFKDLRSEAEARIYESLNSKIDELLDLGKIFPNDTLILTKIK